LSRTAFAAGGDAGLDPLHRIAQVVFLDDVVPIEDSPRAVTRTFTCPVLVHELLDDSLGVSFSGKLIARSDRRGTALPALTRAA